MVPVHTTVIGYRCLLETDTGKIYEVKEKKIYEKQFMKKHFGRLRRVWDSWQ